MNQFQRRHRSGGSSEKETSNQTSQGDDDIQYDEEDGKVHSNDSVARRSQRRFTGQVSLRAMMAFGMCIYLLAHFNHTKPHDDGFVSMADNLPSVPSFTTIETTTNSTKPQSGSIFKDEEQKANSLNDDDGKQCKCWNESCGELLQLWKNKSTSTLFQAFIDSSAIFFLHFLICETSCRRNLDGAIVSHSLSRRKL